MKWNAKIVFLTVIPVFMIGGSNGTQHNPYSTSIGNSLQIVSPTYTHDGETPEVSYSLPNYQSIFERLENNLSLPGFILKKSDNEEKIIFESIQMNCLLTITFTYSEKYYGNKLQFITLIQETNAIELSFRNMLINVQQETTAQVDKKILLVTVNQISDLLKDF